MRGRGAAASGLRAARALQCVLYYPPKPSGSLLRDGGGGGSGGARRAQARMDSHPPLPGHQRYPPRLPRALLCLSFPFAAGGMEARRRGRWVTRTPRAVCGQTESRGGVVCVCVRARVALPRCDSCVPLLVTARLLTRQRAVTVSLVVARHRVHSPPWSPLLGCPRPLVCATRPLALCSSSHRRTRSRRADHCVRAILSPLPWRSAEPPQHAGPPGAHEVQQVPAQDDAAQGDQEEVKTLL